MSTRRIVCRVSPPWVEVDININFLFTVPSGHCDLELGPRSFGHQNWNDRVGAGARRELEREQGLSVVLSKQSVRTRRSVLCLALQLIQHFFRTRRIDHDWP